MEILEQGQDETGVFVIGSGSLLVDGKRIYHAPRIGMRIVPGERAVRRNIDIRPFWRKHLAITSPPMEAFYQGLIHQFIRAFEFEDARVSENLKGRSVLYLANHQCQIESMLFLIAVSAFMESPVVALSNAKHRSRWLGDLVRHSFSYPGMKDPGLIRYFDQSRPESLPSIVSDLRDDLSSGNKSVLVHVEGTRQTSCRNRVNTISALFVELALKADVPIVCVRFSGGLPVEPLVAGKLEFPIGYTAQVYHFASPIFPDALRRYSLIEQKQVVLETIQKVGPSSDYEVPHPPDAALRAAVEKRMEGAARDEVHAVLSLFAEPALNGWRPQSNDAAQWARRWEDWLGFI
jgi:hypothetical protein